MALCLAAGAVLVQLEVASFTLAWTHSVERVRWEEDWRAVGGRLVPEEARIKGSGAGMEPPEDAVLVDGYWRYRPNLAPLERLDLARSDAVADWALCVGGECRAIGTYLPPGTMADVTLLPCGD